MLRDRFRKAPSGSWPSRDQQGSSRASPEAEYLSPGNFLVPTCFGDPPSNSPSCWWLALPRLSLAWVAQMAPGQACKLFLETAASSYGREARAKSDTDSLPRSPPQASALSPTHHVYRHIFDNNSRREGGGGRLKSKKVNLSWGLPGHHVYTYLILLNTFMECSIGCFPTNPLTTFKQVIPPTYP